MKNMKKIYSAPVADFVEIEISSFMGTATIFTKGTGDEEERGDWRNQGSEEHYGDWENIWKNM